jgi:hypothetical protein
MADEDQPHLYTLKDEDVALSVISSSAIVVHDGKPAYVLSDEVKDGQYHHLSMISGPTGTKLYLDGKKVWERTSDER